MSDSDRSAVSIAELSAFDGTDLERVRGFDDVAAVVRSIVSSAWWSSTGAPVPEVVPARRDACASTTVQRSATRTQIRFAGPQCTVATAFHELAHVLAGVDHGHDATFRRALVDVVEFGTNPLIDEHRGRLHVDQLTEAFAAHSLDLASRSWPTPPGTATRPGSTAIAL